MKVKTIGITGASGIIGSKLCQNLIENGYIIHVLTRNPENFKKNPNIKTHKIDLLNPDKEKVSNFTKRIKFLFHLASELNDESKMMKINYYGTKMLVDSIKNKNIPLIYFSSIGVFDFSKSNQINENSHKKQFNLYEKTKFLSEEYILKSYQKNNLKFIILRPSIILDLNMKSKIIDYIITLSRIGIKINFSKKIIANFILLDDVVKIILEIFEKEKAFCQSFNISSNILLEDFLMTINKILDKKIFISLPFNLFINIIGLSLFFKPKNKKIKKFFTNTCKVSCQKIEGLLAWKIQMDCFNFLDDYIKSRK